MYIKNSTSTAQSILTGNPSAKTDNQQTRLSVYDVNEKESNKTKTRLDIDARAMAQVEKTYPLANNVSVTGAANNNTAYDQPLPKNAFATQAYQAVGNIAKRESIQATFGVDVFA